MTSSKLLPKIQFLADKHERSVMKVRFVLQPFSFVFLLAGTKSYHIVLETLDTEEATYIWHSEKSKSALKGYYPIEFMVCAINNGGGFYRTEVYVHEAKISGATINNPCVNLSEFQATVYGTDVYLGFMLI